MAVRMLLGVWIHRGGLGLVYTATPDSLVINHALDEEATNQLAGWSGLLHHTPSRQDAQVARTDVWMRRLCIFIKTVTHLRNPVKIRARFDRANNIRKWFNKGKLSAGVV